MPSVSVHDEDRRQRAAELRAVLQVSFPPIVFNGQITPMDADPFPEDWYNGENILDEEADLYENFRGRRWTEVEDEVIQRNTSGYCFLTDEAYAAFLPAWLARSLDGGWNDIRNLLLISFGNEDKACTNPYTSPWGMRKMKKAQRKTMRLFFVEFLELERSTVMESTAKSALRTFDTIDNDLEELE